MSRRRNKKFFWAIAVAVLLPLSFYIYSELKTGAPDLPDYFVAEKVDTQMVNGEPTYDTTYHQVGDIELINQFGKRVSVNEDLEGKILVMSFFFTDCPTVCPKLVGNIKLLQTAFTRNPRKQSSFDTVVHLVSVTVNPEADSFQRLRQYAESHNINPDKWWLLTGDKNKIYNYARHELHVVASPANSGAEEFLHTQKLVLLDKDRYIRGYYDGLDTAELRRCADDIILLTLEKKRKK